MAAWKGSLKSLHTNEIWKYYQSTSKVHAKVPQNLMVLQNTIDSML